ncbi:unnamed protein product [Anisakis simplex]|uniref:DUF202 domain-containing protein n=1 Tax=Anisakis simplex TaxID=6269 RepID=A0A0M3KKH4_ANISI|nr:unnamed protein product [Anisakis simplex]
MPLNGRDRESSPSSRTRCEIRSVLVKHWRAIERARLHTFHLWLLLFSITQIAVINYLLPKILQIWLRQEEFLGTDFPSDNYQLTTVKVLRVLAKNY